MAGIVFKKGAYTGRLKVVGDEKRGIRGGRVVVYWGYCLSLVDDLGRDLGGYKFRRNAHRKAAATLIADGWTQVEEDQNHG